ncbi:glutathione S-transferase family protein [Sphingobium phenoxybenzoativorans]|uniref:Glutathione S-transferase family protein n=1 Tax=Sphingobium phenoxybenzoativorans TaxID=1592790 RepID=A0A975K7C2_9SPHN|nr:glutathione S-transferase family protein [Sphingobium phenoxybenzoativorans]QUT05719.1 glutathione S-transferase family protein [Sphingobium phenoxybenzoativorans]
MPQPELVLYHFPGACSQVSICALETAGLSYEVRLVNLAAGEQSGADYLGVSPLGKVPLLLIDGEPLSENAAILTYIATLRPDAGLFPADPSPRMRAEAVGGMSFCGGTLHPQIRGIANPSRLTDGDGEPVRKKSEALAKKSFGYAERRLAEREWWLGEWSIVDVYLNWAFTVARNAKFDSTPYPLLNGHAGKMSDRPAFQRMLEIDAEARATLKL